MLSQAAKAIPWLEKVPAVNEANYMLGYAYIMANQLDRSEAAFARLFKLIDSGYSRIAVFHGSSVTSLRKIYRNLIMPRK